MESKDEGAWSARVEGVARERTCILFTLCATNSPNSNRGILLLLLHSIEFRKKSSFHESPNVYARADQSLGELALRATSPISRSKSCASGKGPKAAVRRRRISAKGAREVVSSVCSSGAPWDCNKDRARVGSGSGWRWGSRSDWARARARARARV